MRDHPTAWSCLVLLALTSSVPAELLLTRQSPEGEFEGWASYHEKADTKTSDVWKLNDEAVLTCRGTPRGYLYTKKNFSNFTLSFEWRWPSSGEGGKGGVLLRMAGEHKIWPKSLEVQLNAGQAGDFWALDGFSLTGAPERTERVTHKQYGELIHVTSLLAIERPAGEWNQGSVTLKDGKVTVRMNGKLVNEASGCDASPGKILLTSEGSAIQFRKIQLQE